MEDDLKKRKYKREDIPVIFFSEAAGAWEAVDKESARAQIAAKYKNRLEENERLKIMEQGGIYETRAARLRRSAFNESENARQRKAGKHLNIRFLILMAAAFMMFWWIIENR